MHRRNSALEPPPPQSQPDSISNGPINATLIPGSASSNSNNSSVVAPKEIIDRLRGFLLFSTAPEPFLEAIASRLVPQVYPARTFIITEGEEARAMYWIIKGTVAIVSRDGEALHAELGPGAYFGEIGILFDCPRTASVQARERCVIAVLTAGAVNEVLPGFPQVENIIRNEAQERLAVLAKNRQQQQQQQQQKQKMRRESVVNNSNNSVIAAGSRTGSSATNDNPNVSGAKSSEHNKDFPSAQVQQHRDLGKYLEHTGIREVLAEMPLFQQLPDYIIHRLALSVEPVSYGPFQIIMEHNTVGKDIYFIIDGQVEVLDYTSGAVIARLTRGAYFGEMTFLRLAERRSASVRTITECKCLVVTEATLDLLCEDFPEVHSHIEATAKARLSNNQQLSTGAFTNGASSIYLNKRHNSVSSASDHSSSSSTRDDDVPQQGKPLDHDPFRMHSKIGGFNADSDSHGMRNDKDDGVELFSKSWNTTGSFDGSMTLLRPPAAAVVAPHQENEPHEAVGVTLANDTGPLSVDPAVDMSSFAFDPMGPVEVDTSLPASPHALPDPSTSNGATNGLNGSNNCNLINYNNNQNNHNNNINQNNNSLVNLNGTFNHRVDFWKPPSPGAGISSPGSSRSNNRPSIGGFESIPEEDASTASGDGAMAMTQLRYQHQQTIYKRPSPGILLHPRAKRVRQNSWRRSSLFNVGPFPDFIQIKVFQYLDLRTLMAIQRVCRHWHQILHTSQQLLRELDLRPYNTTINDTTIVPITNFAGLRPKIVDISHCFHLTDEGFSYLVNGIGLAKIHVFRMKSVWEVSSMAIMDLTVPSIGAELEEIDLSNCRKVSDSTLTRLIGWVVPSGSYSGFPGDPNREPVVVGCAKLRKISLSYCKHITDRSLYHMAMFAADRIESLDLTRCTTITDHGFSFWNFRSFSALRHLCLADCTFLTDKTIMAISAAAKGLESLVLSFCCALTDLSVEVLALGCPRLRVLEMQYCGSAVSDMSLAAVAHHLHVLERLSVRGCVRVTAPGVRALLNVSHNISYIDITQCRNIAEHIVPPRQNLFIKQ